MVGLEFGDIEGYSWRLIPSEAPSSLRVDVGRRTQGVEFLLASEARARLTGMRVGTVSLRYTDGEVTETPLTYGANVDCFIEPFASDVTVRALGTTAHLAAFAVETDATKEVASVEVNGFTPEVFVGILAMNTSDVD